MKVLELFAGTGGISKAFRDRGHETYTVDWDKSLEGIDLYIDINTLTADMILEKFGRPDVIWASPDCTSYSVAGIRYHRHKNIETGNLEPTSDYAKLCDETNVHVLNLIKELNPKYWFIENPRGGMRKMEWMQGLPRYTVTYCQYETSKPPEQRRMKPTDIWTNHPDPKFRPACKRGAPCHARAPRGSSSGTQGIRGAKLRSIIPKELCEHIAEISEE